MATTISSWCILRTAPSRTVPLVTLLTAAGYEAWTPQQMAERRISRRGTMKKVSLPLTPSIVFAEYDRLPELLALSRAPMPTCLVWDDEGRAWATRHVPRFVVFRHLDGYPRIADRDLDALRVAEQRGSPKGKGPTFVAGEAVKLPTGSFEGLIGKVQRVKKQKVWVCFGDWPQPIQIAAVDLLHMSETACA